MRAYDYRSTWTLFCDSGSCREVAVGYFGLTEKLRGAAYCKEHAVKVLWRFSSLERWIWIFPEAEAEVMDQIEGNRILAALGAIGN